MGEPKAFASLSSGLLARKGGARPAMRPQGFGGQSGGSSLEDLGWNDMGADADVEPHPEMRPVGLGSHQLEVAGTVEQIGQAAAHHGVEDVRGGGGDAVGARDEIHSGGAPV